MFSQPLRPSCVTQSRKLPAALFLDPTTPPEGFEMTAFEINPLSALSRVECDLALGKPVNPKDVLDAAMVELDAYNTLNRDLESAESSLKTEQERSDLLSDIIDHVGWVLYRMANLKPAKFNSEAAALADMLTAQSRTNPTPELKAQFKELRKRFQAK